MKVLAVTGSRALPDDYYVESVLEALAPEHIIVGDCKSGADLYAARWALQNKVRLTAHAALWHLHEPRGKAGPFRNVAIAAQLRECLSAGHECVGVAFPTCPEHDGGGTWDCVRRLRRIGVHPFVHYRGAQ